MILRQERLCTICARGGSKGVTDKNIRPLLGLPLIVHTINQAKNSQLFARIAVSSDSDIILNLAKEAKVDYLIKRPEEMASDISAKLPAIRHCVSEVERLSGEDFKIFVDLDVTSPLRIKEDIIGAVKLFEDSESHNLLTGTLADHSPYYDMVEFDTFGGIKVVKEPPYKVVRRQDSPKCYGLNSSIYIWTRHGLFGRNSFFNEDTLLFVMPGERSRDIDTELDFKIVEYLAKERGSLV